MPKPNVPSAVPQTLPGTTLAAPTAPPPTLAATGSVVTPARVADPKRGEVYWVNIPKRHTVGSEQYKRRPFLIVSNNSIHYLEIVIGVPLTFQLHKKNRQYRIVVLASDIIMDAGSTLDPGERVALTEQVRCLSILRLEPDRQAKLTDTAIYAVESGLGFVMDIG